MPQSASPMHNGQIVFSEKFAERSEAAQIEYLKKLCSSQNHALDMMQKGRDALAAENVVLKAGLENAQAAFDNQKAIVTNLITQSNAENQGVAARILELETRVKAQDATIKVLNGDLD